MRKNLFADLEPTPAEHFKLFFYGAVLSLFHHIVQVFGSSEAAFKEFPFWSATTTNWLMVVSPE